MCTRWLVLQLLSIFVFVTGSYFASSENEICSGPCIVRVEHKDYDCTLKEINKNDCEIYLSRNLDYKETGVTLSKPNFFAVENKWNFVNISWSQEISVVHSPVQYLIILQDTALMKKKSKRNCFLLNFLFQDDQKGEKSFSIGCLPWINVSSAETCISVISLNSTRTPLIETEVVSPPYQFHPEAKSLEKDCISMEDLNSWNPPIMLSVKPNSITWNMMDSTFLPFMLCAAEIKVDLFSISTNCDSSNTRVRCTHLFREPFTVTFGNLHPGNYCIRMRLFHEKCNPATGLCVPKHTRVVTLTAPGVPYTTIVNDTSLASASDISIKLDTIILVVSAFVIGLIIAVITICLKYRRIQSRKGRRPSSLELTEKVVKVEDIMQIVKNTTVQPTIFLLYCSENEEMDELVSLLVRFMEEYFYCVIIYSNSDWEVNRAITLTPSGWILNSMQNADKIVIIESKRAYQMQQKWIQDAQNLLIEDNVVKNFLYGLVTIQNKILLNMSYEQLFVLKFPFTPSCMKLESIVENCRYIIPFALPNLFCSIHKNILKSSDIKHNGFGFIAEQIHSFWLSESAKYRELFKITEKCNSSSSKF